jgi:5-formyltetrahydrofolate cyclo-ligase
VIPLVAPVESNGPYRHLRVTPLNTLPASRRDIRRQLRESRAAMTTAQRLAAGRAICAHIAATRWLRGRRNIGLYVSIGSEVPSGPLRALAARLHCPVYLPSIVDYRHRRMVFARDAGPLPQVNRLGIPEPAALHTIPVRALSVVLLPVLGFDCHGTRLGTGGGYYDRLFAYRRHRRSWHRPLLVGVAFQCQQLPLIKRRAHDVPLDAVVTENGISIFGPAAW